MSIEGVTSAQIIQKLKGIEEASGTAESKTTSGGSDEVDISSDARLAQTLNRAMNAIDETPDVREDRVAEVQERVESGFYDSDEVIEQVAGQIADTFLGQ